MSLRIRLLLLPLLFLSLLTNSPAQTITGIAPSSGGTGTQITITGTSLAPSGWTCRLFVGTTEAAIITRTSTQIVAIVPANLCWTDSDWTALVQSFSKGR